MKTPLLASVLLTGLLMTGCSTAYQSGQTPDDVYYSPGRDGLSRREEDKRKEEQARYEEYISSQDDRYLRMKVANRNRWGNLDDFDYWYDSRFDFNRTNPYTSWNPYYSYNNPYYFGNYAYTRPYFGWNYGIGYGWNSPIFTVIAYGSPKFYGGSTSGSNLGAFRNKSYNNLNLGYRDPKTGAFVNTGNSNSFGNLLKRVFTSGSNGNSGSSFDRSVRTFTPNASGSVSTSSSAGGNSGGVKSTGSSASSGRGGRGN